MLGMADGGPGTGADEPPADDERYDDDALAEALSAQLHSLRAPAAGAAARPWSGAAAGSVGDTIRVGPEDGTRAPDGPAPDSHVDHPADSQRAPRVQPLPPEFRIEEEPSTGDGPRHAAPRSLRRPPRPAVLPGTADDRWVRPTGVAETAAGSDLFEPPAERADPRSADIGDAGGEHAITARGTEAGAPDDDRPHRVEDLFEPRRFPAPEPDALGHEPRASPMPTFPAPEAASVDGSPQVLEPLGTADRPARTPTNGDPLLSSGGFWFPFLVLGGAVATPFAIALGMQAPTAAPMSVVALVVGVAVVLPAAVRLALVGASGGTATGETGAVLGRWAGSFVPGLLMVARVGAAALALAATGRMAALLAARTGILTGTGTAALGAVVLVGLSAVLVAAVPGRAGTLLPAAVGAVGLLVGTGLLLTLSGAPAGSGPDTADAVPAALSAGLLTGLLLAVTVADLLARFRRPPASGGTRRRTVAGVLLAAAVGVLVPVVAGLLGPGGPVGAGADPLGALVDALVDATPAALAVPVLAALLVAVVPLPAALVRSAGTTAARLAGTGRSRGLGSVAAGLVAVALALGALALDLPEEGLLGPVGLLLAVPVAAWAGVLTTAPVRPRWVVLPALGLVVATLLGWAAIDGIAGNRSVVLDLLPLARDAAWRSGGAASLAVALVVGMFAGLLGRIGRRRPAGDGEGAGRDR